MNKLKYLQFGFISLLVIGMFFVSIPFIKSLNPTQATILSRQTVIGVENIKIGEPIKVSTLYGEVWVIKRSKNEIRELPKDFLEPLFYKNMEQNLPVGIKKETRSIKSDFFVFSVGSGNGNIYLAEMPNSSHLCDHFVRLQGNVKISENETINGGFACKSSFGYKLSFDNSGFIYDLAGRSISPYVSPLNIPNHFYKKNGKLIIGPRVKG